MLKNGHRARSIVFFIVAFMTRNLLNPPTPMPVRPRTGIHKTFPRAGAYDSAKIVKLSPCFVRLDDNLASTFIFIRRNTACRVEAQHRRKLTLPKFPRTLAAWARFYEPPNPL
jgi:hypothetical protein